MFTHQSENSKGNFTYNAYTYANTEWTPHFHRGFELLYVLRGTLDLRINDRTEVLSEGCFALVLSNQIHSFRVEQGALVWVAVFSDDFVSDFSAYVKNKQGTTSVFAVSEDVREMLLSHLIMKEPFPLMRRACLYAICDQYVQNVVLEERRQKNDHLIGDLLDYVSEHFTEDISLESVASVLGYEYHYLSGLLNQKYRISFRQILNGHRIQLAAKMLREADFTITEIAMRCGYRSIRTFNDVFRDVIGKTSREYRENTILISRRKDEINVKKM